MAYDVKQLTVKITGDVADLDKALGKVTTSSKTTGEKLAEFGKVAAAALLAATAAAVGFGVSSVKAFEESQNVAAQTAAVLKSTGGAAGVTADQVQKLATALEKETRFSDETIASTENMLLTFTSIGKDIFPKATETALDMAQALGEDTQSAAIQLGKALQDPIIGVTALRRVGVNFSKDQQDVIKNLVDTGKKAEAQNMILKELQKEFGGSAKAAGETFAGRLDILKNRLQNVQEGIGEIIVKGLEPVAEGFLDWFDSIGSTEGALKKLNDFFSPIIKKIMEVGDKVSDYLSPKLAGLWKSINENIIPILKDLWHNVIEPLLPVLGTTLVFAIGAIIDSMKVWYDIIGTVYKQLKDGNPIVWVLAGAFGGLAAAMAFNAAFDAITIGFKTLQLITIPNAMASVGAFKTLLGTPLVMPAIIVVAAIAAIQTVVDKFVDLINQINDNEARIRADKADTAAIIKIGQDYKAGKINAATRDKLLKIYSRAGGGDVQAGQVYAVGDNPDGSWNSTTELFVPKQSGTIMNAKDTQGAIGGGGTVNLTVNVGMYAGMPVEKRQIALEMYKELVRAARSQGVQLPMIGAVGVQ